MSEHEPYLAALRIRAFLDTLGGALVTNLEKFTSSEEKSK